MPDETLFTILQISDLHFGSWPRGATDLEIGAALPALLAHSDLFDGQLGHHWQGLSDLHRFYSELWDRTKGNVGVVVSGDLTACGAVDQFNLAADFLGGQQNSQLTFGLGLTDWAAVSIPGNHDHWPGSNLILGEPTVGLAAYLPGPYPRVGPVVNLDDEISLRLLYVDSDSDVRSISRDRFLARGKFVSQLETLGRLVPDREDGEIRVLVVHHAVSSIGIPPGQQAMPFPRPQASRRKRLEIDRDTLRVLEHALVDLDIRVLFTGHLHVPRLTEFLTSNDVEAATVLEARCGTTTQLDRYPYSILQKLPYGRVLPPNSLICHEMIRRDEALIWRAEIFWRAKGRGFVSDDLHVSASLPNSLVRELMLVV